MNKNTKHALIFLAVHTIFFLDLTLDLIFY
ncbi:hypothetical protein J2S14_003233 [Lederbergia wuyishanensis]|uniref:Uncharacterized protein n=1 Tax=Lederbergia wuyishanensis TaxID=1347903 RepID=A0ABU0D7M0_9BACI|nr:hypothetical protein [Lederbergia wuyishanensis]